MVVRRRFRRKRAPFVRKRKFVRKRTFRRRLGKYSQNRIYSYKQNPGSLINNGGPTGGWVNGTTTNDCYVIGAATTAPGTAAFVTGALAFELNDLEQVTNFTNLYDQYRIRAVAVKFMPVYNENGQSGGSPSGDLYTCIDYDDQIALSNLSVFRQRQDFKITPSTKGITRYFRPRVAVATYNGSWATSSYGNTSNQWIDSGSPTALHYGLKYAIANAGSSTSIPRWTVRITYYLQFRNVI